MNNYFYSINAQTVTGKKLTDFITECAKNEKKSIAFSKKHKASSYIESAYGFCGGVSALIFTRDDNPSSDWELVEGTRDTYLPAVPNDFSMSWVKDDVKVGDTITVKDVYGKDKQVVITSAMLTMKEMLAVPVVPITALLAILFPKKKIRSLSKTPVMFLYNDCWYVQTAYELAPSDDIESILERTFYRRRMAYINTNPIED